MNVCPTFKKVKGLEEKKKVKGWPIEEMKNKPSKFREDDTEEMIGWRSVSQEEMDQCWKKLAEKTEEDVLDKYKVEDSKRGAYRGRGPFFGMEACAKQHEIQNTKVVGRLAGNNFRFVQRIQPAAFAKHASGFDGRRRDEAEDYEGYDKKIRSTGRMDARNSWWVSDFLAADCEKAWLPEGWEDTMQKWYDWLGEMKKKDERKKIEELHQQRVSQTCRTWRTSIGKTKK